jgi:hypothetical protein
MLSVSKGVRIGQTIRIDARNDTGEFTIQLNLATLKPEEQNAINELMRAGSAERIPPNHLSLLEGKRLTITDAADGPVCRFDLKCVKINKADSIDILELVSNPG